MVRNFAGVAVLSAWAMSAAAATAHAQSSYATYDRPVAASTSVSTGERVERVYSVPAYEPYQPMAFDEGAYKAAKQPAPVAPVASQDMHLDGGGRPYGQPVDVTPKDGIVDPFALSQPSHGGETAALQVPQSFTGAPAEDSEIGFQQESETSRLLLALENTYAERVRELEAKTAAQRKAMLDQFEKDAADPQKVIGLAGRMRSAMAELDAAHKAALAIEERQYNAAMLKVLDASPSRAQ